MANNENIQELDPKIQAYLEENANNKAKLAAEREEDFKKPFDPECILEVRHMRKTFPLKKSLLGKVQKELVAVDDVSFKLHAGETLGIVGESGCGKTTLGRAILKLHQPTGGQIIFDGEDITKFNTKEMRKNRTKMQIIFQDPYSSLPPRSTVGDILSEPVKVHGLVPDAEVKDYVLNLMDKCGLRDTTLSVILTSSRAVSVREFVLQERFRLTPSLLSVTSLFPRSTCLFRRRSSTSSRSFSAP